MDLTGDELAALPGVRGQIERITDDLAAGRNCVWLLPDHLVVAGYAGELHRAVLARSPEHVQVPEPGTVRAEPVPAQPSPHPLVTADVPLLDGFDDGFDIGWDLPGPRREQPPARAGGGPSELMTRLAKGLSVAPERAVDELTAPGAHWRPVIGIRAWLEPDVRHGAGGERGHDVARLVRALDAAVKDVGLLPEQRPRVMVTGRLRDLPPQLPDELELELATTSVHWWWGTVGRLDSATLLDGLRGTDRHRTVPGGTLLRTRVLRALRAEVVGELCGADLALAAELFDCWDGSDRSLDECLRASLAARAPERGADCPPVRSGAALQHKPPSALREAWARGVVQAWEGRPRLHPAVWHADGGEGRPDHLSVLVGQAQARVLMPWLEEARRRLAELALSHANRPARELVELYVRNRLKDHTTRPERTFLAAEASELERACLRGHVSLPTDERLLLAAVVRARNTLSHRQVLRDDHLDDLCAKLTAADLRWGRDT
ncbi:hypothetical protein [Streptomyces sp. NRRL B-3648]|uniref:hypothetical protein n=1 Tax=Streptomyces sp. NRRL B-3648 TaxID=1519493 RepID=UPI0006AE9C08|nr:hypothetical protein [Streptomyces sp. NRRL B-3648]KOV95785.1 hypothetical protein ADL04_19775 [Streptomyces sp. NRRL B-3648]